MCAVNERPKLDRQLDSAVFREYYYLKEELVRFCRENGLPTSGGKQELTERIAHYLETGEVLPSAPKPKKSGAPAEITGDSIIEENFACTEKHRAFFKSVIGKSFSFNVRFQKWLKENAGKTMNDAVAAYHEIIAEKKRGKSEIGGQFEYNTYIRDFFADNPRLSLDDAIKCWKYKKSLPGSSRYERSDLEALKG